MVGAREAGIAISIAPIHVSLRGVRVRRRCSQRS